jgi:hypothetical protein
MHSHSDGSWGTGTLQECELERAKTPAPEWDLTREALLAAQGFLVRYGMGNTSGPRHEARRIARDNALALIHRVLSVGVS